MLKMLICFQITCSIQAKFKDQNALTPVFTSNIVEPNIQVNLSINVEKKND